MFFPVSGGYWPLFHCHSTTPSGHLLKSCTPSRVWELAVSRCCTYRSSTENKMFATDSPLLNIPATLVKRQAIFLDGLRQHAQIAIYAYTRLCKSLSELSFASANNQKYPHEFTGIFLDAWACVEAIDRFRQLWHLQPASETIPGEFSPIIVSEKLQSIRDLRNVSAHVAQKIDQIASLNSSVSGLIRWITMLSKEPVVANTYFIRPGIIFGDLKTQLLLPVGETIFTHETGSVMLQAGTHEANLSQAYMTICKTVDFAEQHLRSQFVGKSFEPRLPKDIFGSARLNL